MPLGCSWAAAGIARRATVTATPLVSAVRRAITAPTRRVTTRVPITCRKSIEPRMKKRLQYFPRRKNPSRRPIAPHPPGVTSLEKSPELGRVEADGERLRQIGGGPGLVGGRRAALVAVQLVHVERGSLVELHPPVNGNPGRRVCLHFEGPVACLGARADDLDREQQVLGREHQLP